MKKFSLFVIMLALGALPALSQTLVAASGVAAPAQMNAQAERGYMNSEIFEGNGMVGIGTRRPLGILHIVGDNNQPDRANQFVISSRNNPNLKLYLGIRTDQNPPVAQMSLVEEGVAWRNLALAINGGNLGVGTLTPAEKLDVMGNVNVSGSIFGHTAVFDGSRPDEQNYRDRDRWRDRDDRRDDRGSVILALGFNHSRVFRVDANGSVYAAKGFYPGGVDYAESVAVTGARAQYTPGDVMAIDKDSPDGFALARQPYSTLVAGVYSTKPGVLASTHPLEAEKFDAEVPLAMFGIVPCKVTAENGPIERGDLLVTSSRPGYAMRGTDKQRMLGAILGKALDPLPSGSGTIRVMLSSR
ncbi:MAG TPA: hypothetical protein VKH81_03330 [Candidatus Angelobacter sp.]|nr:hypothetical protein [Candidatus Angelobacter sp.]